MPEKLPNVPPDWKGSVPEFYIFWALQRVGLHPDIDFTYQSYEMGGRMQAGGAVVDFIIPEYSLAINVQSIRYHYATSQQKTHDRFLRAMLEGYGIRVIYIDEEDALKDPIFYVKEALVFRDHSRMTR